MHSPHLATALEAARAAADVVRRYYRSNLAVTIKADKSPVTVADVETEKTIRAIVSARYPDHGFYGEETEASGLDSEYVWIVDPIDGTNNFGRGMPGFSVSVGVLRYGRPFCGAVYDPLSGQLFTGLAGHGAWLDDRPLRLTPAGLSARSLFCARTPYRDGPPDFAWAWLSRYRLRRVGSTALHLCYVATGALAFVHDQRASLWDIAGAAPVVIEAGGLLTAERGAPIFPLDPDGYHGEAIALLAGDPLAHDQALRDVLAVG